MSDDFEFVLKDAFFRSIDLRCAYVCAVFFGPRRSWEQHWGNIDPLHCLRTHIDLVSKYAKNVRKVIFVCNLREGGLDDEVYKEAVDLVSAQDTNDSRDWRIYSRPNTYFSYGAWEYALQNFVGDLPYAFLIEDDYVPVKEGFDKELLERYFAHEQNRHHVIYCSSWWAYNCSANSNGIINVPLFKHRNTFSLPPLNPRRPWYKHGDACQHAFLRKFTSKGYKTINMADDYSFPFFCMAELRDVHRGVEGGDVLLRPISYEGASLDDK